MKFPFQSPQNTYAPVDPLAVLIDWFHRLWHNSQQSRPGLNVYLFICCVRAARKQHGSGNRIAKGNGQNT